MKSPLLCFPSGVTIVMVGNNFLSDILKPYSIVFQLPIVPKPGGALILHSLISIIIFLSVIFVIISLWTEFWNFSDAVISWRSFIVLENRFFPVWKLMLRPGKSYHLSTCVLCFSGSLLGKYWSPIFFSTLYIFLFVFSSTFGKSSSILCSSSFFFFLAFSVPAIICSNSLSSFMLSKCFF